MNIVKITLDGLSTRIFSSQAVFSNKRNLSSVLSAESKIPGQKSIVIQFPLTVHCYYSSTIQARVYYSWLLFKIPFCLFKEARSSVVGTLHFTFNFRLLCSPFSLLSLSPFSLLSLSSCNLFKLSSFLQAFFKLSSLVHCKIFLLMYNISMF